MLSEKDYKNIELYLSKQLLGAEKTNFEAELRNRAELMEETKFQRGLQIGLSKIRIQRKEDEIREHLLHIAPSLEALNELSTAQEQKKETVFKIWKNTNFKMAIAASFVGVLLMASYFVFNQIEDPGDRMSSKSNDNDSTQNNQLLGNKRESTIEDNPSIKSDVEINKPELMAYNESNQNTFTNFYAPAETIRSSMPAVLTNGVNLYNNKDYKNALIEFEKYNPIINEYFSNSQIDSVQNVSTYLAFYKGVSFLAIQNTKKAILNLEKCRENENIRIQENANWYLGLAYLKENQREKAIQQFMLFQDNDDSPYYEKSHAILEKLNEK